MKKDRLLIMSYSEIFDGFKSGLHGVILLPEQSDGKESNCEFVISRSPVRLWFSAPVKSRGYRHSVTLFLLHVVSTWCLHSQLTLFVI